ncbi:hypothetical protein BCP78_0092 [Bacillus phage BCP78]|uniref:Uncharacterized protein n=3 Tax=Tsarbombavirus BCP78 TaxID=1985182 RepID=J9PQM6_9CAUD|nr:hypothetical protein BCP78_0092 [Bacillus phage BCP78]YP_009783455.1 hypothetical protein QLX27_gp082 [Bacillus phage BCU4]ALA07678.1 hypothetical protein PBC6_085 [Bacillus phage PBC6]AQN32469.1 hypothetical protein BCP12_048 [Bacillus phage BCP12]AXU41191.1 hypothetical protein BC01_094 [Bacillus phage BC01]AEW47099.1 hypothetical protein BCP78_0092 [Bacillus phage BCP78]AEW47588.1 hypothetical protein BCU4_0082 [Bacillus phage BCU4]
MKELYFNIENGECVPAYTCLPSHRAIISGSKVHRIEVSFNISNITRNGYDWFLNQVEDEYLSWEEKHPHLMVSLKKLALEMSLRYPLKHSNFEPDNHRFPFVVAWVNGMRYTAAHFIQKENN